MDGKMPTTIPKDTEPIPLCLHCIRPVSPLDHECPHCWRSVGQFTPCLPYERIWFEAEMWGKLWERIWYRDQDSLVRKTLFTLLVISIRAWPLLLAIPLTWRHCSGHKRSLPSLAGSLRHKHEDNHKKSAVSRRNR